MFQHKKKMPGHKIKCSGQRNFKNVLNKSGVEKIVAKICRICNVPIKKNAPGFQLWNSMFQFCFTLSAHEICQQIHRQSIYCTRTCIPISESNAFVYCKYLACDYDNFSNFKLYLTLKFQAISSLRQILASGNCSLCQCFLSF